MGRGRVPAHPQSRSGEGRSYLLRGRGGLHARTRRSTDLRIANPHGRISVIGAIVLSPGRESIRFDYEMLDDNANYRGHSVARFLRALQPNLSGPLTLIWDRIPIHRGEPVQKLSR